MTTEPLADAGDARADRSTARRRSTPRPAPVAARRAGRARDGRRDERRRSSWPIESSCDETGIALIEDGRRIRANVVASQVALHAADRRDRARGRGARPPALDRAGPRRGVGRRRRDLGRHRRGRGDLRSGPGRLAARRDQLRQGARLGPRQAARRGQPPRGPRLRRLAARPGRGRRDPTRSSRWSRSSSRAATRSWPRCATT